MTVDHCAPIHHLRAWDIIADSQIGSLEPGVEVNVWSDENGLLLSRIVQSDGDHYRLRFWDELLFDIFPDRKQIVESILQPSLSKLAREHYFTDQVLPRVLAHCGKLILHAGAVRVGKRAIVFVGDSGRGKSTLAASFDGAGHQLIGDDALRISEAGGVPCVEAVYPSLRLFPDSIAALFAECPPMSAVVPDSPKQRVTVAQHSEGPGQPIAIAAIFLLAEPSPSGSIEVRKLSPAKLCMAMVENSFSLDPTDRERAQAKLNEASAVARQVPGYEIAYPRDYTLLPQVRAKILAQIE